MQTISRTIQPPGALISVHGPSTVTNNSSAAILVQGVSLAAAASVAVTDSFVKIECSVASAVQILIDNAVSLVAPTRRERFATKTTPLITTGPAVSNGTQVGATFRSAFVAIASVTDVKCLFANGTWAGTGQFLGDNAAAGDITVAASMGGFNNLAHVFPSPGANSALTISPGQWAWTGSMAAAGDHPAVGTYIPSGSTFNIYNHLTVASGKKWYYTCQQVTGDGGTDAVMHASGTGANGIGNIWTAPSVQGSGGTSTSFGQVRPIAIVGAQVVPTVIVSARGDSVPDGSGSGGVSWIERACTTASIAFGGKLTLGGATLVNLDSYDARCPSLAPYSDYWVLHMGHNDPYNSGTLAAMKASMLSQAAAFSMGGARRVIVATLLPRITNANLSGPASAQVIDTTSGAEAMRVAFNDWLRDATATGAMAQAGGNIWSIFDAADVVEVNASNVATRNGGRWTCGAANNTAYTSEGTHPNAAGSNLIAAAFNVGACVLF